MELGDPPSLHSSVDVKARRERFLNRDEMDDGIVPNIRIKAFYESYRLLALIVLALFLTIGFRSEGPSIVENTVTAYRAIAGFVLVLGAFTFPRGPFIRPHPIIWRLLFGFAVLYEMCLILILYQNKKDARLMLSYMDTTLNVELEEREYATNCEVTWSNVFDQFDIFVACHALGWALKALVLRDRLILWHMSVTWEFVEMALSYKLPNFAECWWDHWVMDVLLCNGIGIEVGIWICKYLEVKEYRWHSVFEYPTLLGKLNRTLLQFTPESWIRVEWDCFASVRRYLEIHALMIVFQLIDLNSFFLKRLLWVPTKHPINAVRLLLLCTMGLVVIRQFYVLISHPKYNRLGLHSWLFYIILFTEILLIYKFSADEFKEPMPEYVQQGLMQGCAVYALISITGLLYSTLRSCVKRQEDSSKEKEKVS